MAYTGIYIDDVADQRELFAEGLSSDGDGGVTFRNDIELGDITELKRQILAAKPDIVALDYRLNEHMRDDGSNDYRAGGPAQLLREAVIETPELDFPVILVSTETNIRELYHPDRTSHDLFDQKYIKENISKAPERSQILREIASLVIGYKKVIQCRTEDQLHLTLLGLSADEWELASPKGLQKEITAADGVPHVIARIFLRDIISRTGILLSPVAVYARLGLSPKNQNLDQVFNYLLEAGLGYDGLFSEGWPRIWRHRLDHWAQNNFGKPLAAIPGTERAAKVSEIVGTQATPAESSWTGSSDELFSFACASCDRPSEIRHSIAAHDPRIPAFSERKRICFDCVSTDAYQIRFLKIDDDDEVIAADIVSKKIQRP